MPFLYFESDELKALQDVYDWKSRIGQPLDWNAYDRAKSRIVQAHVTEVMVMRVIVPDRKRSGD